MQQLDSKICFLSLVKRYEVQKISRHLQNRVRESKYQKSQGTHRKPTEMQTTQQKTKGDSGDVYTR